MPSDDIIIRTKGELSQMLGLHAGAEVSLPPAITLGSSPYDSSHLLFLGKMYNLNKYNSFKLLVDKIDANSLANTIKHFPPDLRIVMTNKKSLKKEGGINSLFNTGGEDESK